MQSARVWVGCFSFLHILNGIAAVAYIIAEKSKLRLNITSRGADLIFLVYSASVVLPRTSLKPILEESKYAHAHTTGKGGGAVFDS